MGVVFDATLPEESYRSVQPGALLDAVQELHQTGARLATVVGEDRGHALAVMFAFWQAEGITALEIELPRDEPVYPAVTPSLHAAQWYERELHDLFGIVPEGHPWLKRLALHPDWPAGLHPLRDNFDGREQPAKNPNGRWDRVRVEAEGAFEIPYGPVRSGVFESAQFVVETGGEDILHLNLHMFYKHRGIEKLFHEAPIEQGVSLAEHVSGPDLIAHSTAYCQAVERAMGMAVPERASAIRSLSQELERIYNHLDVVVRECEAASLIVAQAQFAMLKERILRLNALLSGSRFLRGVNCVGGVRRDLVDDARRALLAELKAFEPTFRDRRAALLGTNSFIDRIVATARLPYDTAVAFGAVGPVARGSGVSVDVRSDHPYAAYPGLSLEPITYHDCDAMARVQVRLDEIEESIRLIRHLAESLPEGPLVAPANGSTPAPGHAFGWAESAKGEVVYWVRITPDGRVSRCKVRSASFANWPLFDIASVGTVLTDFGFSEHSFGLSQAACDV